MNTNLLWWAPLRNNQDIDRDLQQRISYFNENWQPTIAQQFQEIDSGRSNLFWWFKENVLNNYDTVQNSLNPALREYLSQNAQTAARVIPEIDEQAKVARDIFGPGGELARQADEIAMRQIDALNRSAAWRQQATETTLNRWWVSRGIRNNFRQQIDSSIQDDLNKIYARQADEARKLYTNVNTITNDLRGQRLSAEDQYLIQPIKDLYGIQEKLGNNIITDLSKVDLLDAWEISAVQSQERVNAANATAFANDKELFQLKVDANIDTAAVNQANTQANARLNADLNIQLEKAKIQAAVDGDFNLATRLQKAQTDLLAQSQQTNQGATTQVLADGTTATFTTWSGWALAPAVAWWNISNAWVNLVKRWEWFSPTVYKDSTWTPTQWYWLTGSHIQQWNISEQQATALLIDKMENQYLWPVLAQVTAPLTQPQKDVLGSFARNAGVWATVKHIVPYINRGDYDWAINTMGKWVTSKWVPLKWLQNRRADERRIWYGWYA